jgi:hypothetical protein
MCVSDDKLALINAIITDDELFDEIADFLNGISEDVEQGEIVQEVEEDDPAPFHMTASKPVYGWD